MVLKDKKRSLRQWCIPSNGIKDYTLLWEFIWYPRGSFKDTLAHLTFSRQHLSHNTLTLEVDSRRQTSEGVLGNFISPYLPILCSKIPQMTTTLNLCWLVSTANRKQRSFNENSPSEPIQGLDPWPPQSRSVSNSTPQQIKVSE